MAFNGTLITVGSYAITGANYIDEKSYKVTKNSQDVDSYRDAEGVLHRTTLAHKPIKVEFQTRPGLSNTEWNTFWGAIKSQFTNVAERKVSASVYVPEDDDYTSSQDMYIPDPEIPINHIKGTTIFYDSIRIAFIGY